MNNPIRNNAIHNNPIHRGFLNAQWTEMSALNQSSDRVEIIPLWQHEHGQHEHGQHENPDRDTDPPDRYLVHFYCKTMVKNNDVIEALQGKYSIGISVPADYLRTTYENPAQVLTFFSKEVYHPNISVPFICIGSIAPATPLVDVLIRSYEVITYNRVTTVESNALNHEACLWARQHMSEFPLEVVPLKRQLEESTDLEDLNLEDMEYEAL